MIDDTNSSSLTVSLSDQRIQGGGGAYLRGMGCCS